MLRFGKHTEHRNSGSLCIELVENSKIIILHGTVCEACDARAKSLKICKPARCTHATKALTAHYVSAASVWRVHDY